jgi:hypothetical protein
MKTYSQVGVVGGVKHASACPALFPRFHEQAKI